MKLTGKIIIRIKYMHMRNYILQLENELVSSHFICLREHLKSLFVGNHIYSNRTISCYQVFETEKILSLGNLLANR